MPAGLKRLYLLAVKGMLEKGERVRRCVCCRRALHKAQVHRFAICCAIMFVLVQVLLLVLALPHPIILVVENAVVLLPFCGIWIMQKRGKMVLFFTDRRTICVSRIGLTRCSVAVYRESDGKQDRTIQEYDYGEKPNH